MVASWPLVMGTASMLVVEHRVWAVRLPIGGCGGGCALRYRRRTGRCRSNRAGRRMVAARVLGSPWALAKLVGDGSEMSQLALVPSVSSGSCICRLGSSGDCQIGCESADAWKSHCAICLLLVVQRLGLLNVCVRPCRAASITIECPSTSSNSTSSSSTVTVMIFEVFRMVRIRS